MMKKKNLDLLLDELFNFFIDIAMTGSFEQTVLSRHSYRQNTNQIRTLYQEFINRYNQLNATFDIYDPIQIHTMFVYLLHRGYLSRDKCFNYSDENTRDIDGLLGVNIITGESVCRHISAAVSDILNDYGIEANQLGVYSGEWELNIDTLNVLKYTKEELVNWSKIHIADKRVYESLIKLIEKVVDEENKNIKISLKMEDGNNLLKKAVGNHAITVAVKDEKSYFLDPTNFWIYGMRDANKKMLYDDNCNEIPIKLLPSIMYNSSAGYLKMMEQLRRQYPSVSKETRDSLILETISMCDSNMDIFAQFYNHNRELYSDISDKVLSIKKKR